MATTAPGLAAAAVNLEGQTGVEEFSTPQITVSNENENEKIATTGDLTVTGNSANTSTNHLQTGANEKDKKKRPFSWGRHKAKADEKVLQPSDSRSDDDTNTTATKTGNGPDGNESGKDTQKAPPTPPVPFFSLYRFHKPHEIALNLFGVLCACGSGASQVRFVHIVHVFTWYLPSSNR
jgi:hypothetical protein